MKSPKDAVILIALFLALIIGGIFVATPEKREESKISTTYNADPMGVKAFYTLLQRMGYSAGRLQRPYDEIPRFARVLIVVQPSTNMDKKKLSPLGGPGISDDERLALMGWIGKGGTAVFLAHKLKGVPPYFGSTHRIGKGFVYAFPTRMKITNKGMRNPQNAVELLNIIDRHAEKTDLILFDEYHHGVIESEPLLSHASRQVWVAMGIIAVALILLGYSRARRFGAVRRLPQSQNVRPGYEFVESVARLYQRADASDLAAGILCDSFKHGLCTKLGMSTDADPNQIAYRVSEDVSGELSARATALLRRCDRAGDKPTEEELVDIAGEVRELEKELGIDSLRH
ncbi:MAG: DUF4350 domain-containing protein [Armatimonadota bacterium]